MSDDTIPQDQLAEVNNLVDESYNNPQNNEVQQLALRSSLRFLSKLGNDSHIFCNPDLEKAAIKSLMIFAYPNTSHLAAYQSFLAGQLARCPQCPRRFHLALIEFEKIMSDTYNYENEMIEELMQLFEQWNRSRITESLSSTYEKIKDITDPKPSEFQEELIPLFECLCAPRLFRDEKLHDMFKKVFFKIQKPNSPTIRPPELLPGVVMFLFSKDDDERMWAEITVNKIKPSEFSTAATFDAMLVQAIDDVIEEASTNPMSEADLERFWGSFNVLIRVLDRKPTEVQVMPRGIFSSQAIDNAIVSMQLIGEFDKEFLQPVLLDDEALLAIILNTYSVHQEVNQSAVDIFCQAFDADDRLTALSSMLNYDLKRSLAVLTSAVKMVTTVAIFPPCPKLIKVAQDVSQCLFGAQAGILNKKKEGIAFELLSYWQTNWKFLEKMFKTTPKWAVHFKNDFMLEFMRDLLDYSGELVDYYRLLEAMMPADMDESTSTNYLLLNSVIDCLTEMCRLLRLKDESLILSCFNIIVSVLGLMRSFDVKPSKALVQIFVQLSSKARGFENIMTSDQLTRLLVDSGAYTSEEAERVVRGSTPEEKEVVEVRQVKKAAQRSIMDFARPGAVQRLVGKPIPPVVQAISGSAPRTSMMDTLRAEVKSRNALKPIAPSKEIHPARPPGFNNSKFGRKAAVESKTATGSSSDEDSSDDSDDDGLFTIKQVLNSNSLHKLRNIEKKPVSAINLGPNHRKVGTDISEKEREERNMMARLQIDLGPLHQQILSWDYHATGDKPIVQKTGQLFATNTRQVPDTFKTVNEYQEVFEPLLMLECWQNIQRSKMEANDKPFKITIANKTLVGNGAYEVRASLPVSSWQECKIGDSDVLVLSYFTGDNVDARYPSKDVPYCLAKIKEIKNTNTDYVELAMRVDNPPLSMHTYLVPLAEFHVLRTVSLTTIEREYCSLRALQYYDLKSEILNALPSKTQDASAERIRKTVSTYNVNESQAKAIISSHYSQGFSLIQGPPGTGKTKTILGIVGSFLTETTSGSPLPPPPAAGQDLKNPDLENLKRILICAPSNAAVDELVLRLKNGVIGHGGKLIKPGIVRLGRSDVINPSVRELTLEELVEQKLNELDDNSNKELMGALRKEQNQTLAERDKLRQEQNATEDPAKREALRLEILALTKTIKATGHKLDLQREQLQVRARKRDIERRKAQAQIIKQSQIICATLSGSAHNVLSSLKMRFDTVIIDEAAQCIELSALIPLKYGCKQCIMVGDPNQLPPTVLSQQAASLKYEQSLFVRMFNKHQDRVHMLNVQFRMHPDIAEFPSKEFYNGKLETGSTNLERTKKVWHDRSLFSPYRFFNVKGSHERSERTKSLFNKKEAMVAFQLYRALENKIGHSEIAGKVGIISPYKQQVNLLKRVFKTELGELGAADIDFNTIDGFQGQEKEVIIISCVRAEPDGYGVGFLGDTRRMNVAVTRAKSALWILGNEESLLKNPVWRRLVADAKQRHCYTDCKPGQLNNLIRNGDQAAHQEKRKFEDDDQSGRKKKKPKSRDDRRVDNRQRNDFNKNRDDKKDRSRNERRDNRPERDARPVDDDDNYEPSLPTGPRQYRDSSSAAATPVQSNYNSRTPSTEHSAAASGSVTPSAQPVGVQNNEPIHEEDGYEPRPASQKPETPVVTGKNDDDDDYEPRPVSQRTVPMKVDDDDSYEPQLGSASLPTSVAPAGGIDDYEPRPPTQRPDVAARNINKVVPLVRRPPPPNQQVRGAPLPLPTMPLPGRPVGPTGVIPPVGPASLMAPSGPAGSSLPTRPSSMKNNSTNMNKFPFNKYQGTAVKKKNRNKKPANVLLPSKRAGPATGNMNTNNNNSNNNKNNNNNNNGPGNNSNRPNNKKNPRNGNNNKPKNKRPGPGPGPGPGAVPSVPTNLNNINNNGRPIPKPY